MITTLKIMLHFRIVPDLRKRNVSGKTQFEFIDALKIFTFRFIITLHLNCCQIFFAFFLFKNHDSRSKTNELNSNKEREII